MTEKSQQQIEEQIKDVLTQYVDPAVAQHGGSVNFISYAHGSVLLEMSGACSGCAGSTMTLKMGIENLLKELVPEVESVEGMDDPFSQVDPYYSTMPPMYFDDDYVDTGTDFDPDNTQI